MTAITGVTEIWCNGPDVYRDRPCRSMESSATQTASDLRDSLAERGWQTIRTGDLVIDRCPDCGNGTA
ncbi:hypothetical protein AMIS_19620 [Actinoplanes missouriensis 431]|uniref:Uncharacterized protein n=1 Tax=Actinoplanes missouriensis (strain ATCC 14538 / DSM 43046 / CBS 188.64 / JCM 3121 / NBRC 102363 / NCIMB 12654 / NRRL B-3342 / UNCC 431) TaxID=512565 RepID=I0H2E5_ACTM4|nr:hypothetical protein [Actinoplanes missouriensis]BAL87182.1 hypothetical protein AMIS_19620 [Actinoplanes missouriensis 431]